MQDRTVAVRIWIGRLRGSGGFLGPSDRQSIVCMHSSAAYSSSSGKKCPLFGSGKSRGGRQGFAAIPGVEWTDQAFDWRRPVEQNHLSELVKRRMKDAGLPLGLRRTASGRRRSPTC